MIPVPPQPEPATFDQEVRQPGLHWLHQENLDPSAEKPPGLQLRAFWTRCLPELYQAYGGICAYLAIFFEQSTGTATTDHFVAKSKEMGRAYDWANFRLACLAMNRQKGIHEVLDPFELAADTFRLELSTGEIFPNPQLPTERRLAAQTTIELLELDAPVKREMRARHFQEHSVGGMPASYLARYSPFVHLEASRQNLLKT